MEPQSLPEMCTAGTFSTAHITKSTCYLLTMLAEHKLPERNYAVSVYKKRQWGFFVYPLESGDSPLPHDLQNLIDYADCHDIELIILDNDGPIVRDIPIYNWD